MIEELNLRPFHTQDLSLKLAICEMATKMNEIIDRINNRVTTGEQQLDSKKDISFWNKVHPDMPIVQCKCGAIRYENHCNECGEVIAKRQCDKPSELDGRS
jgi:hypothetical protein